MRFLSYFRVETNRIFHAPLTWVLMIAAIAMPLFGLSFYQPAMDITKASQIIANPALAGGLGGAVLFGLYTILEFDRVHRSEADTIMDSIVSPLVLSGARLLAIACAGLAVGICTSLIYLPLSISGMGDLFSFGLHFKSYYILLLPCLWFGALFGAVFYQISRRVDISFVLLAASVLLSMSGAATDNFLLRWANPLIPLYSDSFSNAVPLRMALYSRIFWLLILLGAYLLTLLCVRRFGKGLAGSFLCNIRLAPLCLTGAVCIGLGAYVYHGQPFIDHSPMDYVGSDYMYEFDTENAYVRSINVEAHPDIFRGTMQGTATYDIVNYNEETCRQYLVIDPGYQVKRVTANGQDIPFTDLKNDEDNYKQIYFEMPPERELEVAIEYGGYPAMWSIARSYFGGSEISREYIELTRASLAPVVQLYGEEGLPLYTTRITLPEKMTPLVFGTGETTLLSDNGDGTRTWQAQENHVMMYIYAADYVMREIEADGMNVEFYFSRKHERIMEEANITEVLADVIRYCADTYGPLRFYGEDGKLKLVQLTAAGGGGYAGNGMSVMSETSFSEDGLKDPLRGASGSEVMAHEIIHQWWGLGAMIWTEDDTDEWSSEGLTVYSTYRLMKEKYGEEYAKKHYVDVWQDAVDRYQRNFYVRNPEYLHLLDEKYAGAINMEHANVLQYCSMPLKILKAEQLVGGEAQMDALLKELFSSQEEFEMPYQMQYQDFLEALGLEEEALTLD